MLEYQCCCQGMAEEFKQITTIWVKCQAIKIRFSQNLAF